jgi:hypothetical protein
MTTNRTERSTLTQRESASVVVYLRAGSMEKQPQLHSFAGCAINTDWRAGP